MVFAIGSLRIPLPGDTALIAAAFYAGTTYRLLFRRTGADGLRWRRVRLDVRRR